MVIIVLVGNNYKCDTAYSWCREHRGCESTLYVNELLGTNSISSIKTTVLNYKTAHNDCIYLETILVK